MRFNNINQNLTLSDEARLLSKIDVPFKSELRRIKESFILISIFRNAEPKLEDLEMDEVEMKEFFAAKAKLEKWTPRTLEIVNEAIDIEFTPNKYERNFAYRMAKEVAAAYCDELNAYKYAVISELIRNHIREIMHMENTDNLTMKYNYREIVSIAITAVHEAVTEKRAKRKASDEEQ